MATAKTPQDHKAPKSELDAQKMERFEEHEGHELLIPFNQLKASDQTRLMARVTTVQSLIGEDGELEFNPEVLDMSADLIDYVAEHYALDTDEFNQWTMGSDGMSRTLNLVFAYVAELGKGAN